MVLTNSNDLSLDNKQKKPIYLQIIFTLLYVVFPPLWVLAFFGSSIYCRFFKNRFTSLYNSYFLPPAAVIAVFFYIFSLNGIYPFGEKTIAWCDMSQQGVPYWINFKQVLEGEQNLFLNMANAAGMDGWILLRSYFLYPFSYLVLLVDIQNVMAFVSVATVLKLAMCSLTAMVFFRVCIKKLHPSIAVALSMMYSFCAYGTMYYQIINWPCIMYILPLYFAGLYLLLKEHKIWLYSVTIALIMRNFAFGYMVVVATLLFIGYYFIVCEDKQSINKNAFNFTIGSLFGAILSIPIWLPFFNAFFSSARGVDVSQTVSSSANLTSKCTVYPLLMSTAFIFVAAFSYKSIKKKPLEKSIYFLFGLMLVAMVFEPINKMWHFGSYMGFPARYAYITILLGLVISGLLLSKNVAIDYGCFANNYNNKTRKTTKYICSFTLLLCIIYAIYKYIPKYLETNYNDMIAYANTLWGDSESYKHMLVLFSLFLIAYAISYAIYKRKLVNKQIFAFVLVAILFCEGYISISTYMVPASKKMNMQNYSSYVDMTDRIEDEDFYRVKNACFLNSAYGSVSEANYPGSLGYNSMGHYSSLTPESYLYAAKAFGYSSVWMKVDTYGGTKFSDALFSVKYNIDKCSNNPQNVIYNNDKFSISKADHYLPLGVFTNCKLININLADYTRIELQEYVFDSITNTSDKLFSELEPTLTYNCSISEESDNYLIEKQSNGAFIEYELDVNGTKTLYFDCFDKFSNSLSEKINKSFSVYVNGIKKQSSYPIDKQNGLLNLGTYTNSTVNVQINVLKDVECGSFGLFAMNDDLLNKELSNVSTADLNVNGNTIQGDYNADEDGFLFVSVPYNSSFNCEVNGESVKIKNCFGGFIGVPVYKGENTIKLSYTSPVFLPSIIVVVIFVAIIIALIFVLRKRRLFTAYDTVVALLGEKAARILSSVMFVCIILAFVFTFVFVYIYPIILALQL